MSYIDSRWLNNVLEADTKLKRYGILERPSLPPHSEFKEINCKILLNGRSNCGKTALIESLCSKHNSHFKNGSIDDYVETPGKKTSD